MQSKDLLKVWNAPDNTRLTPRQISIRLPLHVAAKISALCEMFPKRTKTEIIGDLLATALDDIAEGLSSDPYPEEAGYAHPDDYWGDRRRYEGLVSKYLEEMESEERSREESETTGPKQAATPVNKSEAGTRRKRVGTETGARSGRTK